MFTFQSLARPPADPARDLQPRLLQRFSLSGRLRNSGRRWRTIRRVTAAGLFVAAGITATWPPPPDLGDPVLVVTRDLAAGEVLGAGDLDEITLPAAPDGALNPLSPFAGRTVASGVRRGEVLTDLRLVPINGPDPGIGRRAIAVRPADAGVLELLAPGMRIAVVGLDAEGGPTSLTTAAIVLTVPGEEEGPGLNDQQRPVLIAVPEKDADRVSAATLVGEIALQFT